MKKRKHKKYLVIVESMYAEEIEVDASNQFEARLLAEKRSKLYMPIAVEVNEVKL
jgi:hypothetical protein